MRGRKPVPTSLHKLRGTFNSTKHKRDRAGEAVACGNLDAAPGWMTEDQQAGWRYVIEHAPSGVLKRIDLGVLAVWVIAEDQHRISAIQQAKIDANTALPLLSRDKNGLPIASPYLGVMNRTGMRMLKAGSELGFSPAARPRLGGSEESAAKDDSPWRQLSVIQGGKKTA